MPELEAVAIARDFKKCDKKFRNAAKVVQDLINEGYTPDEDLTLSGSEDTDSTTIHQTTMRRTETAELNEFCRLIMNCSGNDRSFCICNLTQIDTYCFLLVKRYGDLRLRFNVRKGSGKESRKFLGMTKMTTIDFVGAVLTDGRRFMRVEDLGADICADLFDTDERHQDESPFCESIFMLNPQIKPKHRFGMYPLDEKEDDEYQKVHNLPQ